MNNWISALAELQNQGEPCVLVTIIEERGSTPRNAGSKMVVSGERIFDTIGGGHLEYKAMQIARQMLATASHDTRLERFNLGASLGQCCGGVNVLLFEPMGQPQAHIAVFGAGHGSGSGAITGQPALPRALDRRTGRGISGADTGRGQPYRQRRPTGRNRSFAQRQLLHRYDPQPSTGSGADGGHPQPG